MNTREKIEKRISEYTEEQKELASRLGALEHLIKGLGEALALFDDTTSAPLSPKPSEGAFSISKAVLVLHLENPTELYSSTPMARALEACGFEWSSHYKTWASFVSSVGKSQKRLAAKGELRTDSQIVNGENRAVYGAPVQTNLPVDQPTETEASNTTPSSEVPFMFQPSVAAEGS